MYVCPTNSVCAQHYSCQYILTKEFTQVQWGTIYYSSQPPSNLQWGASNDVWKFQIWISKWFFIAINFDLIQAREGLSEVLFKMILVDARFKNFAMFLRSKKKSGTMKILGKLIWIWQMIISKLTKRLNINFWCINIFFSVLVFCNDFEFQRKGSSRIKFCRFRYRMITKFSLKQKIVKFLLYVPVWNLLY